jgi:hypothetical protein
MTSQIPDQIAKLRGLSRSELLDLWQKVYKKAAPQGIRREILVPFLAHRIQENAHGGLKAGVLAELHRVVKALDRDRSSTAPLVGARLKTGIRGAFQRLPGRLPVRAGPVRLSSASRKPTLL